MNKLSLNIFYPVSISEIHGSFCCEKMYDSKMQQLFVKRFCCFSSPTLTDTNLLILWGSFSTKLINLVAKQLPFMPNQRVILHIRGCEERIDNQYCYSDLNRSLPVNIVFSSCTITKDDAKKILTDARACLKV